MTIRQAKDLRPEPEPDPEPDDVIDAEVIEDDEPHVNRETGEVTDEPPTCETEATPEEAYRDPDDPFGWEHTYKSFQELGKYLRGHPSGLSGVYTASQPSVCAPGPPGPIAALNSDSAADLAARDINSSC